MLFYFSTIWQKTSPTVGWVSLLMTILLPPTSPHLLKYLPLFLTCNRSQVIFTTMTPTSLDLKKIRLNMGEWLTFPSQFINQLWSKRKNLLKAQYSKKLTSDKAMLQI